MSENLNQERLISLDVFRGITIAGMTLVNNPGTWSTIYGPLKHAEWHGITPTDYIFPFFLFIVGVAIPIAFAKRMKDGPAVACSSRASLPDFEPNPSPYQSPF